MLRPKPRPDRVERLQPAEQKRVLATRHGTREGLEQVMMRIDQTRRDEAARSLNHFARGFEPCADLGDHAVLQFDIAISQLAPRIIHRQGDLGAFDQQFSHATPPKQPRAIQG